MKKLLIVLAVVLLAAAYPVSRGMLIGVSFVTRGSKTHIECSYLHWDGIQIKAEDRTGESSKPYCQFLEN